MELNKLVHVSDDKLLTRFPKPVAIAFLELERVCRECDTPLVALVLARADGDPALLTGLEIRLEEWTRKAGAVFLDDVKRDFAAAVDALKATVR